MKRIGFIGVAGVLCVVALFNWLSSSRSWDPNRFPSPWEDGPAIYGHVMSHIGPAGGLRSGGEELPDESRFSKGSPIRWAAGARDSLLADRMSPADQKKAVSDGIRRLNAVLQRADARNLGEFYQGLLEHDVGGYAVPFLEATIERGSLPLDRLAALARWIATEAPDREPVKLAMVLLSVCGSAEDADLLLGLGRHDEFTTFAAFAGSVLFLVEIRDERLHE